MDPNSIDRERVRELREAGLFYREIAAEIGCSKKQVERIIARDNYAPGKIGRQLSAERRALAQKMVDEGKTASEIRAEISMSYPTLFKYFPQLKGRTRARVPHERIAELTRIGWSAKKIGEELGCSERHVVRVRSELGMSKPIPENSSKPVSPERLEQARRLAEDGCSIGEISRTMRMTKTTVARHFPEARQDGEDWRHLWGQIRNKPKLRNLFDEMGGIT